MLPEMLKHTGAMAGQPPLLDVIRQKRIDRAEQERKQAESTSKMNLESATAEKYRAEAKGETPVDLTGMPKINYDKSPKEIERDMIAQAAWLNNNGMPKEADYVSQQAARISKEHGGTVGEPKGRATEADIKLKEAKTEEAIEIAGYYKNVPRTAAPQPTEGTIMQILSAIEVADPSKTWMPFSGMSATEKLSKVNSIVTYAESERAKGNLVSWEEAAKAVITGAVSQVAPTAPGIPNPRDPDGILGR